MMRLRGKWRWCWRVACGLLALGTFVSVLAELWTHCLSSGWCYASAEDCPADSVGLVLGCSPYGRGGRHNLYFDDRMEAASALWQSGRVQGLIVSGDNRHHSYNEPRAMKEALIARGVPAERIACDYGGICTYDSVARARQVFGVEKLVVVSQAEHAARAVAIARHLGIASVGLGVPLPPVGRRSWCRQFLRERCARVSMVYDFMTARQPRFLGEPESLPWL